ncbi:unnamed protein product [Cochlearia groenlandica]
MAFAKMCFEKLYGLNSVESKQLYESMMLDDDLTYERMECAYKELVDEIGVQDFRDELEFLPQGECGEF